MIPLVDWQAVRRSNYLRTGGVRAKLNHSRDIAKAAMEVK
jgi:hypothetical protein